MKTRANARQTIADVAIERFGSIEAMYDIARLNGMSVSDGLEDGMILQLPDQVYDKRMQSYCDDNKVCPATADVENKTSSGIFTDEYTEEYA